MSYSSSPSLSFLISWSDRALRRIREVELCHSKTQASWSVLAAPLLSALVCPCAAFPLSSHESILLSGNRGLPATFASWKSAFSGNRRVFGSDSTFHPRTFPYSQQCFRRCLSCSRMHLWGSHRNGYRFDLRLRSALWNRLLFHLSATPVYTWHIQRLNVRVNRTYQVWRAIPRCPWRWPGLLASFPPSLQAWERRAGGASARGVGSPSDLSLSTQT